VRRNQLVNGAEIWKREPVTHRTSYWKTTAVSFVAACLCLFALVWFLSSSLPPVPIALIRFLLAASFVACLFVATGGLVCLWRDARRAAGKEDLLTRAAIRIPAPGLLSRLGLRFLRGTRLRPGDLAQVRPRREIEATLDGRRTMAGLPFMPEMEVFCDRAFRVHRRVDHINDMRNKTGLRRIHDVVTLTGVRCSGAAHNGCQAECQILWKDAWLRRLPNRQRADAIQKPGGSPTIAVQGADSENGDRIYFCQMTALWEASQPMLSIDVRQDLRPLISANIGFIDFLLVVLTRIFNIVQRLRGGVDYPFMPAYPLKGQSPSAKLRFDAGDAVVVRKKDEIARTLVNGRNKGLWFDRDMIRFCGKRAIVRKRVSRIIHDSSGKMVVMKTPCVMLEDVIATGEFLRLCPQHEYIFWREIWLTRPPQDQQTEIAPDR
jgi:hypothetical protein